MKEFAKKGYNNASTNEIVKEAGISKGLLFHYFRSKKDLFLFLFDYSVEVLTNELYAKIDFSERDIFERLKETGLLKYTIYLKHPELYNFILTSYLEEYPEVKNQVQGKIGEMIKIGYAKLLENIDYSKFKVGFDVEKCTNIILWTLDGLVTIFQKKLRSFSDFDSLYNEISAEVDGYFNLLKESFYKREES